MNIEELVFNMYKDKIIGARKFRLVISKKYKLNIKEITNIYTKIHNYQIKKYGERLSNDVNVNTKEECIRMARIRKQARKSRLNRKGKWDSENEKEI